MKAKCLDFNRVLLIMILTFLICQQPAKSQTDEPPVQFHGRNVVSGQYANQQGAFSNVPRAFIRNDLYMSLTVHGIPIATNFFVTSEQNDYKQSINNIRFYIDLNAVKKRRAKIETYNKAQGRKDEKAPGMIRFLSNFSRIEAGKVRPIYSDFTLKGVSVSGVNVELTNKYVYAAFASGRILKATKNADVFDTTYTRKLLFGKLGFGEKRRTHFYLTYMHVKDEAQQAKLPDSLNDSLISLRPHSNTIFGTELQLSFFKQRWIVFAEAGISFLTRDNKSTIPFPSGFESYMDRVPQWMINIVEPNATTSVDYAYKVTTKLNLNTTTISGGYIYVSSGYVTLGNPNLINDQQILEGRIDQAFHKRKITASAFFRQVKDNLRDWKLSTSENTLYGLSLRFAFPRIPYFYLSYTPNIQEITGQMKSTNNLKILTASAGYSYDIGNLKSFTSINYIYQDIDNQSDSIKSAVDNHTFTLNQVFRFQIPFYINFNITHTNANMAYNEAADLSDMSRKTTALVLSLTHESFKKRWKNTLGGKYMKTTNGYDQNKTSIFLNTSLKLYAKGTISLSFEENIFSTNHPDDNDFNEFIARLNLSVGW